MIFEYILFYFNYLVRCRNTYSKEYSAPEYEINNYATVKNLKKMISLSIKIKWIV